MSNARLRVFAVTALVALAVSNLPGAQLSDVLNRAKREAAEALRRKQQEAQRTSPSNPPESTTPPPSPSPAPAPASSSDQPAPLGEVIGAMSRDFKPEVKVTFSNGASFNLAEFELVDEPNAPYDLPQASVQSFPGAFSEVIDCMEANKCVPLFEAGAWHAIDSRKIAKLTVQLAKNPQSSTWLAKGAQTFKGETYPAFGFLKSEMSDAAVFLSISATTSDGKAYSGTLPENRHIVSLEPSSVRIFGYTRQLGKETPLIVNLNQLQELQCAGHVCQVKYFTERSTEAAAEFRVREDGLRQAEIHRTKLMGGAEDSSLISLTTAERGMVRLPLMAARFRYATTDQFYETETHEFNNTLSIAVTGPTSRKKVKSHGVFDDVEMGAIPIEVRTRSGEAARVYFNNRKSIRGWTSNGKLIYTRVVGYSGQPIVKTIDILGAPGR